MRCSTGEECCAAWWLLVCKVYSDGEKCGIKSVTSLWPRSVFEIHRLVSSMLL